MNLKKIILNIIIFLFFSSVLNAAPSLSGNFKDWKSFTADTDQGKICFAQSIPKKRSPKNFKRGESRLFVTFRPGEKVKNEISVTSGHVYRTGTVSAKSGKNNYSLFSKNNFAWIVNEKEEERFVKLMKKATDIMVISNEPKGSQTVDHYSMIGFTDAYNKTKKNCS